MHKIIVTLLVVCFIACNRDISKVNNKEISTNYLNNDQILVVSFISKGGGTDKSAIKKFIAFVEQYNLSSSNPITYEVKSWGREGEKDYCINTSNKEFLEKLKKEMTGIELVRIKENAKCRE